MEDFTTFTKVDPNSHIVVVSAAHIDFTNWDNESTYLYRDYGADFFSDFTHMVARALRKSEA